MIWQEYQAREQYRTHYKTLRYSTGSRPQYIVVQTFKNAFIHHLSYYLKCICFFALWNEIKENWAEKIVSEYLQAIIHNRNTLNNYPTVSMLMQEYAYNYASGKYIFNLCLWLWVDLLKFTTD